MEKKSNPKTEASRKCLDANYKQYKINVRKEKFAVWEQYAASQGKSMRALLIEIMDREIEKSGFVPEKPKSEE